MNKDKQPKLSIITVCYNNKSGLQKTLESVKRQTYKDYEYIIIDGGSTDGTVELIKENEAYIDYWVSEKDNGIYNAMNKGIQVAKGEYCYFLNSDDCLATPETLEKIFKKVKDDPDIIYGNLAILKNGKLHFFVKMSSHLDSYSFYRKQIAIHHQASFIKRDLFDKYGFYNEEIKLISDWVFFFQMVIIHHVKTQYINRVFAVFLAGGESSIGVNEQHIKDKILSDNLSPQQIKRNRSKDKMNRAFQIGKLTKLRAHVLLYKALITKQIER